MHVDSDLDWDNTIDLCGSCLAADRFHLRNSLRIVLDKFPDDDVINTLMSDAGPGHRRYTATLSDQELLNLRLVLKGKP